MLKYQIPRFRDTQSDTQTPEPTPTATEIPPAPTATPDLRTLIGYGEDVDASLTWDIHEDITWTVANSPYLITHEVRIADSATLTIEPGVVLDVSTSPSPFRPLKGNSGLIFTGTARDPVIINIPRMMILPVGVYENIVIIGNGGSAIEFSTTIVMPAAERLRLKNIEFYRAQVSLYGGSQLDIQQSTFTESNIWGGLGGRWVGWPRSNGQSLNLVGFGEDKLLKIITSSIHSYLCKVFPRERLLKIVCSQRPSMPKNKA